MMWTAAKNSFSNLLEKIARTVHLDAKRTITWYSYILLVIPIAYWMLIEMRILASKQSWTVMLKQPAVAIASIIAIVDFMLGYYLIMRKKDVLASYENYRLFMMWQAVCQILVGNFLCFVLALIGIHEAKKLNNGPRDSTVTMATVASGLLLIFCFVLLVMLNFIKG